MSYGPRPQSPSTSNSPTVQQNMLGSFITFLSFHRLQSSLGLLHRPSMSDLLMFLVSTLPLQIYLIVLLHLPSVYKARMTNFSNTPSQFISEWRSLMAISSLVLSAIIAIFQLPGAFADPFLRLMGFLSSSFGLLSLLYSFLFVNLNQLGSSGTEGAAVTEQAIENGGSEVQTGLYTNEWTQALDGTEVERNGYWNPSVLMALPVVWTAWSVITFMFTFVLLLCRSSLLSPTSTATATTAELVPVMLVLVVGTIYPLLAVRAFRS